MQDKKIQDLLISAGIEHELSSDIKPSVNPLMRDVISNLSRLKVCFVYFDETDSLVIISSDYHHEIDEACNCLLMPTSFGIEILVPLSYNQQSDGTLDNLKKMFEAIIPYHIEYRITGVM
tara:strand:+ start:126 stop:485 length:360 start_codon:yes stop_codon:yes gene_type:complete